jgi:hypothetical protein
MNKQKEVSLIYINIIKLKSFFVCLNALIAGSSSCDSSDLKNSIAYLSRKAIGYGRESIKYQDCIHAKPGRVASPK